MEGAQRLVTSPNPRIGVVVEAGPRVGVIAESTLDIRAGRELLLPAVTYAGQSRVSVESSCLERSTQRRGPSNEGQRRENIAPLIISSRRES